MKLTDRVETKRTFGMLIAALITCTSSAALAQVYAHEDRPELITSTTSTTSAVAVGVIMLTVVSIQRSSAIETYLRDHEIATREALALGAGPAVGDLAALFDVPQTRVPEFGRLLRQHRAHLVRLAFRERDPAALTRFLEVTITLDPRFAPSS